jgi:hypothetical protein
MSRASADLPGYVEHGGEIVYRPPYQALDVRMYAFAVQADYQKLDDYCDALFRRPSNGNQQWHPICDHALVVYVNVARLSCSDPPDSFLGGSSEKEASVWLPMFDIRHARCGWAVPYIFTDNDVAQATGREVYGYFKQIGDVTAPRGGTAPEELKVNALSFAQFGPDETARREMVMHAVRSSDTDDKLVATWHNALAGLGAMTFLEADPLAIRPPSPLGGTEPARRGRPSGSARPVSECLAAGEHPFAFADAIVAMLLFEQFVLGRIPLVFLKQFRDAQRPGSACYQAIVEGRCTDVDFHQGGFLPAGYRVGFANLASQPFRRELGLKDQDVPRIEFWADLSYKVALGDVLWESSTGRQRR